MSTISETLEGFDPLTDAVVSAHSEGMLNEASRRIVQNILKSYTGYFDLFSELIQNSLDAVDAKVRSEIPGYEPRIWVLIDLKNPRVRVTDNGIGMRIDEFKQFLAPNVSFKSVSDYRGQKGVGATFLAYGFSFIRAHTRRDGETVSTILRQGRQWATATSDSIPRPKFENDTFNIPELSAHEDGTSIEIVLSGTPGERPRDLNWLGARSAKQWCDVLRIKTPLGGVYLQTPAFKPTIVITVIDYDGSYDRYETVSAEYWYPHEMDDQRVATVREVEAELLKINGSPEEKFQKLPSSFKRLDILWDIYNKEYLLADISPFASAINEEERALIERHNVVVYASFLRSSKMWGTFNDEHLGLRKGQRIIHGGLQMASDTMVQGDLSIIPLTSTIGYQANSHVIVHFTDGSPDLGRKVFQPELKELADSLAVRCVNIFKRYLQHLKADTGAVVNTPDKALYEWKKAQEDYRDRHPLALQSTSGEITLLSRPQQEQDVIALFHQLIGIGIIRGLRFYSTSSSERYDSLYFLDYNTPSNFVYSKQNKLGVDGSLSFPFASEPRVLEYKYDLDALIREFTTDVKYAKHINLVVCWKAEKQFREKYYLNSLLVSDEGGSRLTFGATHQAFADGSSQPDFEVIILEDLIGFLTDEQQEIARQKLKYKD